MESTLRGPRVPKEGEEEPLQSDGWVAWMEGSSRKPELQGFHCFRIMGMEAGNPQEFHTESA